MDYKKIKVDSNSLLMGCLVVGALLVGGFLVIKSIKSHNHKPLMTALKDVIPPEAQGKILINQDKVNTGKQYISLIHNIEDESHAAEIATKFVYEAFARQGSSEMANVSAVNIVLYKMLPGEKGEKPKAKQYRILIGAHVAAKQDRKFWEKGNSVALLKWLTEVCPTTDSRNLMDFCDISSSLKQN